MRTLAAAVLASCAVTALATSASATIPSGVVITPAHPARPASLSMDPGATPVPGINSIGFVRPTPDGKIYMVGVANPHAEGGQMIASQIFARIMPAAGRYGSVPYTEAHLSTAPGSTVSFNPLRASADASGNVFVAYSVSGDTLWIYHVARMVPSAPAQPAPSFNLMLNDDGQERDIAADGAGGAYVRYYEVYPTGDSEVQPRTRLLSPTGQTVWDQADAADYSSLFVPNGTSFKTAATAQGEISVVNVNGNGPNPALNRAYVVARSHAGATTYKQTIQDLGTTARGATPLACAITYLFPASDGSAAVVVAPSLDTQHQRLYALAANGTQQLVAQVGLNLFWKQLADGDIVSLDVPWATGSSWVVTRYGVRNGRFGLVSTATMTVPDSAETLLQSPEQIFISPNEVITLTGQTRIGNGLQLLAATVSGQFIGHLPLLLPTGVVNDGLHFSGYELTTAGTYSYVSGISDPGSQPLVPPVVLVPAAHH